MKIKYDLLCYAKEKYDQLYLNWYLVNTGKANSKKSSNDSVVFDKGIFIDDLTKIEKNKINRKILFLYSNHMFRSDFSLPRLNPKKLVEAIENRMDEVYENNLEGFSYCYSQKVNETKGFDIDLLIYNEKTYFNILNIFASKGIQFDECHYLPQLYQNFLKPELDNCFGIFNINNFIEIFFVNKNSYYKYEILDLNKILDTKDIGVIGEEEMYNYITKKLILYLKRHFYNDPKINSIDNVYTNLRVDDLKKIPVLDDEAVNYIEINDHHEIYPYLNITNTLISLPNGEKTDESKK